MMRLTLVACSKTKLDHPAPAVDLYTSPLFRLSMQFARRRGGEIRIISAKHGLLEQDRILEPYDQTLSAMTRTERLKWGERVVEQLCEFDERLEITFMAGRLYVEPIISAASFSPEWRWIEPLKRMMIGERLSFLSRGL